jgi:hypothetical protein
MTLLTAWQAFCDVTGISLVVGDPLLALLLCICAAYLAGPRLHSLLLDALPPEEPPSRGSSRHGSSSSSSSRSRSERRDKGASASPSASVLPQSKHRTASKHSSSSSSRAAQAALETAARDALRARAGRVFREGGDGVLGPPSQVKAPLPSASDAAPPPPLPVFAPSSPAAGRPPRPDSRGGFRADSPDSFAFAPHRPPRSDTPDPLVRQMPGRRTVAFAAEEEHIPPAAPAAVPPSSTPRHGAAQHLDSPPSRGSSARGSPRSPLGLSSPPASPPQLHLEPFAFPAVPPPVPVLSWEDELRAELAAEEAAAAAEAAEREAAAAIEAAQAAAEEEARREKSDMVARLLAQAEALAAEQRAAAAAERAAALEEERHAVAAALAAAAEAEAAAQAALAAVDARSAEREAMECFMGVPHGGEDADTSFAFSISSVDDGASVATDEAELAMVSEAHQRAEALRAAEAIIEAEAAALSARLTAAAIAAVVARTPAPAATPVQRAEPPSPPSAHARPPLGHHKPSALARRRRRDDGEGEAQPSPVVPPEQAATPTPVRSSLGTTLSLPVTPPSEGSVTSAMQSRAASLTELALMAEAADAAGGSWYGSTQASPAGTPPPSPRHPLSRSVSRASSAHGGAMPEPPQEHRIGRRSNSPLPRGGNGSEQQLLTPEEADALGQLKIVMDLRAQPPGSPVKAFCTDACLARYLRASRWDVAQAAQMVHATMEWRRSSRVEEVTWDEVGAPLSSLPVFCLDVRDRYGRPVLVLRPGAVTSLADEAVVRLLEYTMEHVCCAIDKQTQSAHPPRGSRADLFSEQLLLVVDGTDWSVMVPGGRTALRRCMKILARHYPERLGAALVLHPPRLFGTMWAVVSSFLDARTAAKVHVVSTDKFKQRELLAVYFDNLGLLDAALGGDHSAGFDERVYVQRMRDVDATRARSPGSPSGSTGPEASSPRSPARHDDEPLDEVEGQEAQTEAADTEVADITASTARKVTHRSRPSSRVDQRAAGAAIAAAAMQRAKQRAAVRDGT